MGNSACSCCLLCLKEKEAVIDVHKLVYKSICEYPCNTLSDLTLRRGDILEVIEEGERWVFAKKISPQHDKKGFTEEQIHVPRDFVKPVDSLEAQP